VRRLLVFGAVCTAALVVGPLQAGAKGPPSAHSYVSQLVSFYEQVAAIVKKDSHSCGKMGADLQAFSKSHQATVAALNAAAPKISKTQAAAIVFTYETRFATAATTIGQGIAACSSSKALMQMFSELNKLKK
jgi:creatinine amidohydrolase/Fe(II)-dependent formamide hydrolase-like protein